MVRHVLAAVTLGLFSLVTFTSLAADDGDKKRGGKERDPETIFKSLDTDNDGKLSKDEFAKFAEKFKGAGKGKDKDKKFDGSKLFERLDEDGDGYLTLEEFKKLREKMDNAKDKIRDKKRDE